MSEELICIFTNDGETLVDVISDNNFISYSVISENEIQVLSSFIKKTRISTLFMRRVLEKF